MSNLLSCVCRDVASRTISSSSLTSLFLLQWSRSLKDKKKNISKLLLIDWNSLIVSRLLMKVKKKENIILHHPTLEVWELQWSRLHTGIRDPTALTRWSFCERLLCVQVIELSGLSEGCREETSPLTDVNMIQGCRGNRPERGSFWSGYRPPLCGSCFHHILHSLCTYQMSFTSAFAAVSSTSVRYLLGPLATEHWT